MPAQPERWSANEAPAAPGWGMGASAYGTPPSPPASPMYGVPGSPGGTPASALFDESALPEWLRQAARGQEVDAPAPSAPMPGAGFPPGYPQAIPGPGRPWLGAGMESATPYGEQQPVPPSIPPAQPLSAFPSIENVGASRTPPSMPPGLAGPSLIDPAALPPWLGGQGNAPGTAASAGAPAGGNMAAQSLIDESALPQWLRAEPNATTTTTGGLNPSPGPSALPRSPSTSLDEPLPAWLNQVYADANVPRIEAQAPDVRNPQSPALRAPGGDVTMGSGGRLAGSDFVDESALPEWLRSQGAQPVGGAAAMSGPIAPRQPSPPAFQPEPRNAPLFPPVAPAPGFGAVPQFMPPAPPAQPPQWSTNGDVDMQQTADATFSASDLIDPGVLPQWVRGDDAPASTFSSATGWTNHQPAVPPVERVPFSGPGMENMGRMWDDDVEMENTARVDAPNAARRQVPRQPLRAPEPPAFPPAAARPGPGAPWPDEPVAGRIPESILDERRSDARANPAGPRRGAPIPPQELPSWLQRPRVPQGSHGWWEEDDANMGQGQLGQMDGWGDADRAGAGDPYGNYDNEERGNPRRNERNNGNGWRRFFGRK